MVQLAILHVGISKWQQSEDKCFTEKICNISIMKIEHSRVPTQPVYNVYTQKTQKQWLRLTDLMLAIQWPHY